jgi:predicted Zn-dependent protease
VLRFHEREDSIEFVIFRHHEPLAFSLAGTWIAISTGLLEHVQTEDQLCALVAHELGHQYFITEFWNAYEANDLAGMRQLELACDAIAAVTLIALGKDPSELEKALSMIINYSVEMKRNNDGTGAHPALDARLNTIQLVQTSLTPKWPALETKGVSVVRATKD